MISEPLPSSSSSFDGMIAEAKRNPLYIAGDKLFIESNSTNLDCCFLFVATAESDILWHIIRLSNTAPGRKAYFYIWNDEGGMRGVQREEFVDYVATNDPDQFDWLLFHPEWLR